MKIIKNKLFGNFYVNYFTTIDYHLDGSTKRLLLQWCYVI